ncbi:MAG TPA: hypothetical protein GXX14_00455, partial [Clostridiaceae bacterium]|nr:hypothetical protein [Clostridiaceae bacterium]
MHFRRVLIVTAVIVFLCAVSLAVYNGLTSLKSSKDTSTEDHSLTDGDFIKREEVPVPGTNYQEENQPETGDAGQNEESQTDTAEKVQNAAEKTKPEKTQELKVLNNTLEYDFKAVLVGREGSGTFLKISHYLEGAGVEKEFGSDFIDELKHISITGSNEGTGGMDMSIGTVYLNPKQSKAYFILRENSAEDNMANVSLYSYNMIDGTIKKLFSDTGTFTDLFFTKDYKYMGFSYYDHPSAGALEEN